MVVLRVPLTAVVERLERVTTVLGIVSVTGLVSTDVTALKY